MLVTVVSRFWTMGLQACALILIVLAARQLLKKYPKLYSYCLWALVGARLLCPFLIRAPFSLQPDLTGYQAAGTEPGNVSDSRENGAVPEKSSDITADSEGRQNSSDMAAGSEGQQNSSDMAAGSEGRQNSSDMAADSEGQQNGSDITAGSESREGASDGKTDLRGQAKAPGTEAERQNGEGTVTGVQTGAVRNTGTEADVQYASGERTEPQDEASDGKQPEEVSRQAGAARTGSRVWEALAALYLAGVGISLGVYLMRYLLMKRRTAMAVRESGNVWLCENVSSPFVLGIFSPKIMLPYGLSETEKFHVLQHERTHIRHHDPLIRFAGVLCLCLHWWNPLVWLAVHKMNQDMEMFCDEAALRQATAEERKDYARALLSLAVKQSGFSLRLAFGESNTEMRVRNIMKKRKKSIAIVLLTALLAALSACAFMTSPQEDNGNGAAPAAGNEVQDGEQQGEGQNTIPSEDGEPTGEPDVTSADSADKEPGTSSGDGEGGTASAQTPGGSEGIVLTDAAAEYLAGLCAKLPDFESEEAMDASFWQSYLFAAYTSDFTKETASLYSEQYGSQASYVRVSREEADRTTEQIFGKPLSKYVRDPKKLASLDETVKYFGDGNYYVAVSDSPAYVFELQGTELSDGVTKAVFMEYLEYETEPLAQITLSLVPAENEYGFIVTGKTGNTFSADDGNQILWEKTTNRGTWRITDYIAPGVYALTQEEIESYIGSSIYYGADYFRLGDAQPQLVTGYSGGFVTAEEFDAQYGDFNAEELKISGTALKYYEAETGEEAPFGTYFYQTDYDNALIYCEGVFFRAVRERTQSGAAGSIGQETADDGRRAMLAAYTSALESFYFDHTSPTGEELGFWENSDIWQNYFAVFDIDRDGKDELIIQWTTTYVAGQAQIIYGYDAENDTLTTELMVYPWLSFYDNGLVEAMASHNHGLAPTLEDFWPYTLYRYNAESDTYEAAVEVDAWDRAYAETSGGNVFPEAADKDGDGIVYYFGAPGGEVQYLDRQEYNEWRASYIGDGERFDIQYQQMTAKNIYGIK